MKKIVILFASIFGVLTASGQETDQQQQQFLFPRFESARVVLKTGVVVTVPVNFSLITNCFVFLDAADNNEIKEFAEIDKIATITVGSRVFQPSLRGEAIEIVQFDNPTIFVRYSGKTIDQGQKTAYGGRSTTSSIKSYSSLTSGGTAYRLEGDDRMLVKGVEKTYLLGDNGGRMKKFTTLRQLQKIFPKQHTEAIERFATENKTDFDSVEQVVKLCNFAASLK